MGAYVGAEVLSWAAEVFSVGAEVGAVVLSWAAEVSSDVFSVGAEVLGGCCSELDFHTVNITVLPELSSIFDV